MLESEHSVSNTFRKQYYKTDWWNGFLTGFVMGGLTGALLMALIVIGVKQS